ncbi:TIGR04141 family sporadically distributed protein [Aliarcobacter butzleri]|uniref:DUF6119 family protein n=1 Tax=Aliarcobacter butzleri TaxID=28197 RepID=UPI00125F17BF|nr:DUF6119 family protein [Aliarcobacter butzleri]MDN5105772.1 TIGR04141 family sporadically distributed protein [Aliarcobacter butzleri]
MADKWQVNIYKINAETKETKIVFGELEKNDYMESQKVLKKLLKTDGTKYNSQKLYDETINNFQLYLYYRENIKLKPDWKDFLSEIVEDGQSILKKVNNKHESFVLFLYQKISKNLYAICGGHGFFMIQDYIIDSFGIDVLSRIVDSKNKKIIAHAKELGVTGSILGITKHFRQNFNFYENSNFGNIYREITTYLDKDTVKKVGLDIDSSENALCLAKNSFKVNKSITFDTLIKIIEKCDHIIENEDIKIDVNNIKLVDNKKNSLLIEKLDKELFNFLWKLNSDKTEISNIDISHKDFNNFLTATKFQFNKTTLNEREYILTDIINSISSLTKESFLSRLRNGEIISYDENSEVLTRGKFLDHLILELEYEGNNYFFINGKWFVITSNFIDELNQICFDFINNNYNDKLSKVWSKTISSRSGNLSYIEGDYNLTYKGELETIVLDTLTPEGIEPCDILKYDDKNIFLFHVKKGFNNSMRDLCSQVFLSANRINEDIYSNSFNYLTKVYSKMSSSTIYQNQISEDDFLNLFKNGRKLIYVLSVLDESEIEKNLKDKNELKLIKSNVAKFSLKELMEKMMSKGFLFEFCQIKRN